MSESLAVLIDHDATEANATAIGESIIDALVAEGCILPTPNSKCVLTGEGFPPGPRLNEIYGYGDAELRYWDMLTNCGVKVHAQRYVNFWAFPVFESAECPACEVAQCEDEVFFDGLYECVSMFMNDGVAPDIHCPACGNPHPGKQWKCTPDVGISFLAIEFWNWPPFDATGWKVSVPKMIEERTNRTLSTSWGRM